MGRKSTVGKAGSGGNGKNIEEDRSYRGGFGRGRAMLSTSNTTSCHQPSFPRAWVVEVKNRARSQVACVVVVFLTVAVCTYAFTPLRRANPSSSCVRPAPTVSTQPRQPSGVGVQSERTAFHCLMSAGMLSMASLLASILLLLHPVSPRGCSCFVCVANKRRRANNDHHILAVQASLELVALDALAHARALDAGAELDLLGEADLGLLARPRQQVLDAVLARVLDQHGLPAQRVDGVVAPLRHGVDRRQERIVRRVVDVGLVARRDLLLGLPEDLRRRVAREEGQERLGERLGERDVVLGRGVHCGHGVVGRIQTRRGRGTCLVGFRAVLLPLGVVGAL